MMSVFITDKSRDEDFDETRQVKAESCMLILLACVLGAASLVMLCVFVWLIRQMVF